MTRRRVLEAVAMVLIAAGCASVGPDYRGAPPEALIHKPSAQRPFLVQSSAVSAQEPPQGWWRLYRDDTLARLVDEALAANTDLRIAQANLERSQAVLAEAKAARQPDVVVGLGTGYTERSAEAYIHAGTVAPNFLYDAGISVSYDLDLFGKLRRGVEAASAESEAFEAARDLVRVNVVAETVRAYAEVCDTGNELDATRRALKLQEESALLTQRMQADGRAITLEVSRQQGQVEQLRASVPTIEARQLNALIRLATITGKPPAELDPQLARCHTPLRLDEALPVGDGAALLKRRPDIRAAERHLAASTAQIGVMTAALYPSITLGASLGTTGTAVDFGIERTRRYSIGPAVTWHLNQSVPRAKIAQANADAKAALARFDGTVLTALREVETALNVYVHDLERVSSLENARAHAARVVADAQQLQTLGRIGSLAVLDAQRTYAASEQGLAAAQTQVSLDQVAVFLALGGGWGAEAVAPPKAAGAR